jgi:hypothetical protein
VLTTDDEDLDPSIEATLPVILQLMHAAAIETNGLVELCRRGARRA